MTLAIWRDRLSRRWAKPAPADDYTVRFEESADAFSAMLRRAGGCGDPVQSAREVGTIAVVVTPWVCTAVPWYAVMIGLGLRRRGRPVVFVLDDTGFPQARLDEQLVAINRVVDSLAGSIPVLRASACVASAEPLAAAERERLVRANVTWHQRGAPIGDDSVELRDSVDAALTRAWPRIRSVVAAAGAESVVIPGGVFGTSGLFLLAAQALGVRAATFDADRGVAQLCVNGVAAQNMDVPHAFARLVRESEDARRAATDVAVAEFEARTSARDRYGYQARASGAAAVGPHVLVPLNVEWDTAALGKNVHFDSTLEWISATVATAHDASDLDVIVRQHPSERRPSQRSQLDIAGELAKRFGKRRCRVVPGDAPVNTYDLLRSAVLVVPFTSNIGVEAAALGLPVVLGGAAYYERLGFVHAAASREEYLSLVAQGARGALQPLPEQVERAWLCYYLVAVRNRLWTSFTAQPDDFWTWSRQSPAEVFDEPEVSDLLAAIDTGEPVAWVRHQRSFGEQ